jgi:hypothetical protein
MRALTGRSGEPGLGRRGAGGGSAAIEAVYELGLPASLRRSGERATRGIMWM